MLTKFLLTHKEKNSLKDLHVLMKDLHSVMLALQDPTLTMAKVYMMFDGVMEKFPKMKKYINVDSEIKIGRASCRERV